MDINILDFDKKLNSIISEPVKLIIWYGDAKPDMLQEHANENSHSFYLEVNQLQKQLIKKDYSNIDTFYWDSKLITPSYVTILSVNISDRKNLDLVLELCRKKQLITYELKRVPVSNLIKELSFSISSTGIRRVGDDQVWDEIGLINHEEGFENHFHDFISYNLNFLKRIVKTLTKEFDLEFCEMKIAKFKGNEDQFQIIIRYNSPASAGAP